MTKTQNTHFRLTRSELISRSCFLFSLFLTFPFINGVFSLIQLLVVDLRRRLKGRENNRQFSSTTRSTRFTSLDIHTADYTERLQVEFTTLVQEFKSWRDDAS